MVPVVVGSCVVDGGVVGGLEAGTVASGTSGAALIGARVAKVAERRVTPSLSAQLTISQGSCGSHQRRWFQKRITHVHRANAHLRIITFQVASWLE